MEAANLGAGLANWAERTKFVGIVACGRGDHCDFSPSYSPAP